MTNKIRITSIPKRSIYNQFITKIDYKDSYTTPLTNNISISNIYLNTFALMPKWITNLMRIRNKIVSPFGLKTTKKPSEVLLNSIKEGKKAGIFTIYKITDNEIIAGDKDKHLDFIVSVFKEDEKIVLSTLVQFNNLFGKIYMTIIIPFHKLVVKAMLKNAIKNKRI